MFLRHISRVKLNIIANFAGSGWAALMSLVFVPVYIRFMSIEAYGLIGFYTILQGAFQILDFGLSPTMNREMARYLALPEKAGEASDFVRTLEVGYWMLGAVIGVGVWGSAPFIAAHWLRSGTIPVDVVQQIVRIMGIVFFLQWPLSFYQGGLMGLQHQALLNGINMVTATLKNGGAALILWLVSPTIKAFFVWLIVISAIQVALTTISFWRRLPPSSHPPRFTKHLLRNVWRFAVGISGIAISAMILTQLDKVILSRLLNLKMFGYYTLAGVVSNGLATMLIGPVFNALFPRFSMLAAVGDQTTLRELYHRASQFMAALVLPVAAVLVFFSFDIMRLWTGSTETALNTSAIVSVLVVGTALNGLMTLPYALQLAHGWTSIGLRINIFLIITLVPGIFFMTTYYGAVGAAAVWVALNTLYMLVGVPLTHRRLLVGEAWRWVSEDVGLPLAVSVLAVGIGRGLIASPMPPVATVVSLSTVLLSALAAAIFSAPKMRAWAFGQLTRFK